MKSLRARLLAVVASTALALVVVLGTNMLVTRDVEQQLLHIQQQQIPKLELGPRLEAELATLKRAFQDAVAAHDLDALERTHELRDLLVDDVDRGQAFLDPALVATFKRELAAYYTSAFDVSRRMMNGSGGEDALDAMRAMQQHQARAQDTLDQLVVFDQRELKSAFDKASAAETAGAQRQLFVILAAFAVVLLLTLRNARYVTRSLGVLQAGVERFGAERFDERIAATNDDEIAAVANEANRMAEKLAAAASERKLNDWVRSGLIDLGDELRGELTEEEVASRAVQALARRVSAPAAALYVLPPASAKDPRMRLLGHHAAGDAPLRVAVGEGILGAAAQERDLTIVEDLPDGFLRVRSGLGDAAPRRVVFVPLVLGDAVIGVLELALFTSLSAQARELLTSARGTIAIALAVAQSRAATTQLLEQTQQQARQLLAQEEELKSTNEELRCQQEELRHTNDELAAQRSTLESRNVELQEVGRRLEQKATELATVSMYKSQFLANMSHELRTPLNSMLLLSKLLEENSEKTLTAKQVEYARTVHGAGKDLLLLINQVLDLAKIEAGKQTVKLEPVSLVEIADRMRRTFEPLAKDKGITFAIATAPGLPDRITTDRQHLTQILTNLIGNAIKFTEKGSVELHIRRPRDGAKRGLPPATSIAFAVVDTGAGIAPEHQSRIFEPFEQVDGSAQRKQGGTGLGLGIARELASLLGGELRLESAPGKGSTFTCTLPEQHGAPGGVSVSAPPPTKSGTMRAVTGDVHLLVIEDDPTFANVLGDIIRERGLVHLTARDGKTGLALARERQPRGIILDVKLPDMDGWRVMEELRADPATAAIPVHFISGVEMAERGLAMGAAGYLLKPAERPDLVRVIESLGPRRDRAAYKVLVVENEEPLGQTLLAQLTAFGLTARRAPSGQAALDVLARESFTCMIVDLGVSDIEGLELLEKVKATAAAQKREMPAVVIYTSRPLNRAEAARLESYAEAVVLKEGASTDRLLDEIRLFVRRLEAGLPPRNGAPKIRDLDVKLDGKKLLVVDDDMRTVYALSAMLRARGAEVLTAETGAVALTTLDTHPDVNAVLMDVMMPEMDGYEATRRIRAQPRFAALPIVALTAKAMKGDLERCIEAGATDYLAKPIDTEALLTVLQARMPA